MASLAWPWEPLERDVDSAYEPFHDQDLQPWERRWEETYRFEPEEMER